MSVFVSLCADVLKGNCCHQLCVHRLTKQRASKEASITRWAKDSTDCEASVHCGTQGTLMEGRETAPKDIHYTYISLKTYDTSWVGFKERKQATLLALR